MEGQIETVVQLREELESRAKLVNARQGIIDDMEKWVRDLKREIEILRGGNGGLRRNIERDRRVSDEAEAVKALLFLKEDGRSEMLSD